MFKIYLTLMFSTLMLTACGGSDAQNVTLTRNVSAVAAGGVHTVALKSDGTLWAWGDNRYGQLGDGTTEDKTVPKQIGSETNWWSAIAAGDEHTVAVRSDGTLWAWGDNEFSQLGDGNTEDEMVPAQIGSETNWSAIAGG